MIDEGEGRQRIFTHLADCIERVRSADRATVVGITGIDASGKSRFAADLDTHLHIGGASTQLISVDDFHNPKAIRYAGPDPVSNYLSSSFDFERLRAELLEPISRGEEVMKSLTVLELDTDDFTGNRTYQVGRSSIVIVEGVFLLRPDIRELIDLMMFLDIGREESKRRAVVRNPGLGEGLRDYDQKYLPAQEAFHRRNPPADHAHLIIDNEDWKLPKVVGGTLLTQERGYPMPGKES